MYKILVVYKTDNGEEEELTLDVTVLPLVGDYVDYNVEIKLNDPAAFRYRSVSGRVIERVFVNDAEYGLMLIGSTEYVILRIDNE